MMSQHTAHALRKILPDVEIYDYGVDFNTLWKLDIGANHVVVVYAGTPGDARVRPVNTTPLVDPVVWALCAKKAKKVSSVTILDLAGHPQEADSLRGYVGLLRPEALPWLRILSAADVIEGSVGTLQSTLRPALTPPAATSSAFAEVHLTKALRQQLTDPSTSDDRHAISNIIGPLLLLGGWPADGPSAASNETADHLAALRRVLLTCRLIDVSSEAARISTAANQVSFDKGTRLFLLDDQWQQGWGEWVCTRLSGVRFNPDFSVESGWTCISTPDSDVKVFAAADPVHLLSQLQFKEGQQDKRFAFAPCEGPVGNDVLLLDLRLFAGDVARERAWTSSLVKLCERFTGTKHAWPGFDATELEEILTWTRGLDSASVGSEQLAGRARTLLGRLLALTDMSLPIVLFSSTADSDLLEQFKEYGNIITTFHKPRTFGSSVREDRLRLEDLFADALSQAKVFQAGRRFIYEVNDWAAQGRKSAVALKTGVVQHDAPAPWKYAELYIDESGPGPDRVGGYIVLYSDPGKGPDELANALPKSWGFDRESQFGMSQRRLQGTPHSEPAKDLVYEKMSDLVRRDPSSVARELGLRSETVMSVANSGGFALAGCMISLGTEAQRVPLGPDATYRTLAALVVEFFLYDWLPALEEAWQLPEGTIKAGAFMASRQYHPGGGRDRPADLHTLVSEHWRFGLPLEAASKDDLTNAVRGIGAPSNLADVNCVIGYTEDGVPVCLPTNGLGSLLVAGRSISWQDAYAIVVSIAKVRGIRRDILNAVAVGMREYGGRAKYTLPWPSQLPRRIHYASDDFLFEPWEAPRPEYVAEKRGFSGILSSKADLLFQASRSIDAGQLSHAVRLMKHAVGDETRALLPWLSLRLKRHLDKMSGGDFVQFVMGAGLDGSVRASMLGQLTAVRRRTSQRAGNFGTNAGGNKRKRNKGRPQNNPNNRGATVSPASTRVASAVPRPLQQTIGPAGDGGRQEVHAAVGTALHGVVSQAGPSDTRTISLRVSKFEAGTTADEARAAVLNAVGSVDIQSLEAMYSKTSAKPVVLISFIASAAEYAGCQRRLKDQWVVELASPRVAPGTADR